MEEYSNEQNIDEPMKEEKYNEIEQEELMIDEDEDEDEDEEDRFDELEASDSSSSVLAGSPHGSSSNSSHSPSLQIESPSSRICDQSITLSGHHPHPEKRHICDICGKGFSYFSILESHKRSHTGEKPFNCHFCDKKFAQKATLQVHERTHTGERPYKCRYCDKTFAQYGTKTVHEKSAHLGIRNYKCPKCDKSLSSPSALYTHKKTHGDKTFHCEFCPKTFALKNYLKLHVKQVHEQNERKHVCKYCHKGFAYAGSLQVHVRTHTGERPYTCRYCPKAFASQGNLQSHERTHTGERPYSCQFCQRTFIQKSQLTAHESTHVSNKNNSADQNDLEMTTLTTPEQPGNYECSICQRKYPYASSLYVHMKKHSNEKGIQYSCSACQKMFHQKECLNLHLEQCESYKTMLQLGKVSNMSSTLSNDDSDSDAEIKIYPIPPPSSSSSTLSLQQNISSQQPVHNIYQQVSTLNVPSICHLSELKLPNLTSHISGQQLNFGLSLNPSSQSVFGSTTNCANVVAASFTPMEISSSDIGPLIGSKPPMMLTENIQSENLSAFHTPLSKSSMVSTLTPSNQNSSLESLSTSLLSTQLLLQQFQQPTNANSDQLNYLLQQNLLSLAAAAAVSLPQSTPTIPNFLLQSNNSTMNPQSIIDHSTSAPIAAPSFV